MRLVSLDPGGTTGLAYYDPAREVVPQLSQIKDRHVLYNWLEEGAYVPTIYICEDFIPRQGAYNFQRDSLLIIGYLDGRHYFWQGSEGFVLQSAATAKAFASDSKLRKLGWYLRGVPHGIDAARHLLTFLVTTPRGRQLGGEDLLRRLVDNS